MKKLVILLLFFALNTKVFADNGSTSVQSSVTSISNSGGSTHTNIKVEDNGNVTTYSSDQDGSVNVNSVNGASKITVNGDRVFPTLYKVKPSSTLFNPPTITPKKHLKITNHIKLNFIDLLKKIFPFI